MRRFIYYFLQLKACRPNGKNNFENLNVSSGAL